MKQPKYWSSIEELDKLPKLKGTENNEFLTDLPLEQKLGETTEETLGFSTNRRDFLKLFGFGLTAATLAACNETALKKVIPYVVKPDDVVPGVANWYSSTCNGCSAACSVIVKTREGRPIKLEGNPESPISKGGMCALGHSTILSMYDIDRLRNAKKGTSDAKWEEVDKAVGAKVTEIKAGGKGAKVRVLSSTITSPSTLSVINDFLAHVGGGQHVTYDAVSYSAIAQANLENFGKKVIPSYNFGKAEVIVSFGADFLGTWLSPVQFTAQYITNRKPENKKMSRHFQIEALMSLTGSNADARFPINPAQEGLALLNLYNKVAAAVGQGQIPGVPAFDVAGNSLVKIAAELVAAKGKSLVVCGTNDVTSQTVVNAINSILGNIGTTVDLDNPSFQKQGDDAALAKLVADIEGGAVEALFIYNCNPVYDTAYGEKLAAAIKKVGLSVSFAIKEDETSEVCTYTCPDSSEFESWNDAMPVLGQYSVNQPTINTIFDTRQAQQSFMTWMGKGVDYLAYIQNFWQTNLLGKQSTYPSFQTFWDETLRHGVFSTTAATAAATSFNSATLAAASTALGAKAAAGEGKLSVVLYETVALRDGKHANNPWLQEMPDPVTRVCWDGYVTVSALYAKEKELSLGSLVEVTVNGKKVKLPVVPQPGQAKETLGIALGYGRTKAGKTAAKVGGENAFKLVGTGNANTYAFAGVTLNSLKEEYPIAKFQKYDLMYDPNLVEIGNSTHYDRSEQIMRETTLEKFIAKPNAGNEAREHTKKHLITLWDSHYKDEEKGRIVRWVMAIDLNKCTGCGACVISCHAENNVPVVGKQEIINHRDMHWLRIDRYYSGEGDNPSVVFQPMMCQHCANAPCETVCPVLATVHSKEGLNMMTYNRCVGTRYCANNCPYKVRRFNWFKYHNNDNFDFNMNNELGKLALNPDVTVRFRGVMEKCSFCVQRLQDAKLRAKINANSSTEFKSKLDIKTACQQSCPTGAIVFGDLNDKNSEVAKLFRDERSYTVLEEVKTLPSVSYLTRVRNRKEGEGEVFKKESHDKGATAHEAKHEEKKAETHP